MDGLVRAAAAEERGPLPHHWKFERRRALPAPCAARPAVGGPPTAACAPVPSTAPLARAPCSGRATCSPSSPPSARAADPAEGWRWHTRARSPWPSALQTTKHSPQTSTTGPPSSPAPHSKRGPTMGLAPQRLHTARACAAAPGVEAPASPPPQPPHAALPGSWCARACSGSNTCTTASNSEESTRSAPATQDLPGAPASARDRSARRSPRCSASLPPTNASSAGSSGRASGTRSSSRAARSRSSRSARRSRHPAPSLLSRSRLRWARCARMGRNCSVRLATTWAVSLPES
mmetsp:Transcript_82201/g.259398  ORF Transcript_82201/g.259398 Transcript_82201/m.259398 type:complete len:291 (+) Transcript_82201:56-928(+)